MPSTLDIERIKELIRTLESDLKQLKTAVKTLEKKNKKSSHEKSSEAYRRAHRWCKEHVES